jgi:hypothetical protein
MLPDCWDGASFRMAQISITDGTEFLSDTIPTDTARNAPHSARKKIFLRRNSKATKANGTIALLPNLVILTRIDQV